MPSSVTKLAPGPPRLTASLCLTPSWVPRQHCTRASVTAFVFQAVFHLGVTKEQAQSEGIYIYLQCPAHCPNTCILRKLFPEGL